MGFAFDNNLNHVSEELSAGPSLALPEILWNFGRYSNNARITLEQNPHFYLRCPADESAYTPTFRRYPLKDPSGALECNDTVYVLFDRPCRVFLDSEHKPKIFGNIWLLNSTLIFRGLCYVSLPRFRSDVFPDDSGVIEGEQLVKSSSIQGKLWYCEQPVLFHDSEAHFQLNHRCLRPIVTIPLGDSPEPTRGTFEDWTTLSRPISRSINIHIYVSRESPGSTISLVGFHVSGFPNTRRRLFYRILFYLQHSNDQNTPCSTRL
jgi:hypothetical protein